MDDLAQLLSLQDGVIARRQALAAGGTETGIRRLLRRRAWVAVHPGVYVDHTGPLSWDQRAWAAVLIASPAALGGWSAVRAHEGARARGFDESAPIEVLVPHDRHPAPVTGVRFRRTRRFADTVQPHLHPPRQRYDDAVLELADHASSDLRAIAVLADACGSRRTTPSRLRDRLDAVRRLRRRTWLRAILRDLADGACSVLEHAYLVDVERAHGLPRGRRQERGQDGAGRSTYRDVVYAGPSWRQYVELDGRMFHDSGSARDRDLERDLDAALDRVGTVRLGYGQVLGRPCSTAAKVGLLLQQRGWEGRPTRCPACAEAAAA